MKNVLLCTLGSSGPVITETIDCLLGKKQIKIDKLIIFHTSSELTLNGLTELKKGLKERGFEEQKNIVFWQYSKTDIDDENDNREFFNAIVKYAANEKQEDNKLYFSIAGGRKTMSSLGMMAAYLTGAEAIFHVTPPQQFEKEVFAQKYEKIDLNKLNLIEVPVLKLNLLFEGLMDELDPAGSFNGSFIQFLLSNPDAVELFDKINSELKKSHNERKLKEKYLEQRDKYELLAFQVETIIKRSAKIAGIKIPLLSRRVKEFDRLIEKKYRKEKENYESTGNYVQKDPFTDFSDIAGVRIVCYFKEHVEQIAKMIREIPHFIAKEDTKVKPSGYKAVHFDVKFSENSDYLKIEEFKPLEGLICEVQIKTNFDNAAQETEHHLKYKSDIYSSMKSSNLDIVESNIQTMFSDVEKLKDNMSSLFNIYSQEKN